MFVHCEASCNTLRTAVLHLLTYLRNTHGPMVLGIMFTQDRLFWLIIKISFGRKNCIDHLIIFTRATLHWRSYYLWSCVCVCLSVCHKSEFLWNSWTNRNCFGISASFRLSCTVLKGNSSISKTRVFPCGSLSQIPDLDKKLSSCWRTTRRAVLFENMRNVAQMFIELQLKSLATGDWPSGSLEMARIDRLYDASY